MLLVTTSTGGRMPLTTVSVLFMDLVGSTELLSRVGEATAAELRREHFTALRGAIEVAGGREVKNLGDGLMVAFDGAGAALACAVAMQQAMDARPADREPSSAAPRQRRGRLLGSGM